MIELVDKKNALAYTDKYFDFLTKNGYVKPAETCRQLAYLFIVDFIETLYSFITDEDYVLIEEAMGNIAASGCILPYTIFCARKLVVGEPGLMNGFSFRITEQDDILRTDEEKESLRITEQ